MRQTIVAAALPLLLLLTAPVGAGEVPGWRCSSVIISRGDTRAEVLDKCGEPSGRETVTEPRYVRNANGSMRQMGVVTYEIFTYEGSHRIPVRLTFEEGKVSKLEYID
jgi:hypothetical protein